MSVAIDSLFGCLLGRCAPRCRGERRGYCITRGQEPWPGLAWPPSSTDGGRRRGEGYRRQRCVCLFARWGFLSPCKESARPRLKARRNLPPSTRFIVIDSGQATPCTIQHVQPGSAQDNDSAALRSDYSDTPHPVRSAPSSLSSCSSSGVAVASEEGFDTFILGSASPCYFFLSLSLGRAS